MGKITTLAIMAFFLSIGQVIAQNAVIKGAVKDDQDGQPLPDVVVSIQNEPLETTTNASGEFSFEDFDIPLGEQVLVLTRNGYQKMRFEIVVEEGQTLDMGTLEMSVDLTDENFEISTISLSDSQLDNDRSSASNLSGLLTSSKDVFLRAAAFSFSATFFRTRGYDQRQGQILINGIEMNKIYDGDPEYSSFGGLNDLRRNQVYTRGIEANNNSFGGLNGTNNTIMRATQYRKGGRVSYASSNRSYRGRVMASYSTGIMEDNWAFSFLASRRYAEEGFREGTPYDANSFMASIEKKFNDHHSLNLTTFYTPNRRGKATAITEEVFDIKGKQYNPFWGYQNGDIRNSRMKEIREPVVMLNHYWDFTDKTRLNTNVAYQSGTTSNSRIENGGTRLVPGPNGHDTYIGGARNTSPIYYQNLPSYHLQDPTPTPADYEKAFFADRQFRNDGQLDWNELYFANVNNIGGNSTYIVKEDVREDKKFTANTILTSEINEHLKINSALKYRNLTTENYALVNDLLGGDGYLDIDNFFEVSSQSTGYNSNNAQSDVNNPNRIVEEGDRYNYNYDIDTDVYEGFAQAQFQYNKLNFFVAGNFSRTIYQRDGKYRNGYFPNNSFGKGEKLDFNNYGVKGGITYKVTGRHLIKLNAGYLTQAPTMRNSYSNARQNEFAVEGLESEKIRTADLSYIYQAPRFKARLTGYYSGFRDGTDIGFFFTQGLAGLGLGNEDAFVQRITNGIDRRNMGLEFGVEADITSTISLKAAGSFSQYVYTNNPNMYLTSDDFNGSLRFGNGKTNLENYHVAGGPENAVQIGFEYSSPDYWWISPTANYFSNAYIDISNLRRSDNFVLAPDGLPINNVNKARSRQLLQQEQFDDYFLFNVVGGKSWKIGDYFVGFFATINNIFDKTYKSGGFEQSRKANYTNFNEDQSRENGALFGNRYFYGYGTTYYLNLYLRF